jgi:flagellar protein FliS
MTEILNEEALYQKTPQELTLILYQALMEKMTKARETIRVNNYEEANHLLQTCNDILVRLGAGLNYEAGIIADQLESIYQYLAETTIKANITKDVNIIEHMLFIMNELINAWINAMRDSEKQQTSTRKQRSLAYEGFYETSSLDIKE